MPDVCTWLGSMLPIGTTSSTSTIVVRAAIAMTGQFALRRRKVVRIEVEQRDPCAAIRERRGDRLADAARATRDDDGLAVDRKSVV